MYSGTCIKKVYVQMLFMDCGNFLMILGSEERFSVIQKNYSLFGFFFETRLLAQFRQLCLGNLTGKYTFC